MYGIGLVSGAMIKGSSKHTEVYLDYMAGKINITDIFIAQSYGGYLGDKCQQYYNRTEYIGILNSHNINCTSDVLCNNGSYGWEVQVEHIIDKKNSICQECPKNIYGNIVMASATWNKQMGVRKWHIVEKEKRHIYGNIFNLAEKSIHHCKHKSSDGMDFVSIFLIIIASCFCTYVFICGSVAAVYYYFTEYKKNQMHVTVGPYGNRFQVTPYMAWPDD
jgi:hypothetical protein